MGEKSVAGFYAAIGYMVASWQYFNNANDPAPFMELLSILRGISSLPIRFSKLLKNGKSKKPGLRTIS